MTAVEKAREANCVLVARDLVAQHKAGMLVPARDYVHTITVLLSEIAGLEAQVFGLQANWEALKNENNDH